MKSKYRRNKLKKTIISNLKTSNKKELSVYIFAIKTSKFKVININIVIISADVYYVACHLKKTQVFAVSIRDI